MRHGGRVPIDLPLGPAREHLLAHGVDCSPVRHVGDSGWEDGPGGRWNSFVFFDDPDGNSWTVQEKPTD